jgi:hypothetical protein
MKSAKQARDASGALEASPWRANTPIAKQPLHGSGGALVPAEGSKNATEFR